MSLIELADLEQGSPEWHDQRRGMVTASVVKALLTTTGRVADNDYSRALTALLVAERITGYTEPTFMNSDMWRGVEDEPRAVATYSEHYEPVTTTGFMVRDDWGLVDWATPRRTGGRRGSDRGQVPPTEEAPPDDPRRRGAAREHGAAAMRAARLWPRVDRLPVLLRRDAHVPQARLPRPKWFAAIEEAVTTFEANAAQMIAAYESATQGLALTERVLELEMSL
jgi:hypothetical protein